MKLWLTQDSEGRFWLHGLKPIIATMLGTNRESVFEQTGDPFRLPASMCRISVQKLLGDAVILPAPLTPTRIDIHATIL